VNIIPLLIFGDPSVTKKGKREVPAKEDAKKEPPSTRHHIYGDIAGHNQGKCWRTFSISFPPVPVEYTHKLAASPPDNSVEHVKTEYDLGQDWRIQHCISIQRCKGGGSLVFHQQDARLRARRPV
jgi:hypothetical protein